MSNHLDSDTNLVAIGLILHCGLVGIQIKEGSILRGEDFGWLLKEKLDLGRWLVVSNLAAFIL